jgi:queuine tRNA-ribosyltransferase
VIRFKITRKDRKTKARCGKLRTRHAEVPTPNFMPVATQATVKTLSPADLKKIGVQIIICNTYHLMLRPGPTIINDLGGLHRFMNWDRAILTEFSSHLDGSRHFLSPEIAIQVQEELKPDVAMCLDFFSSYPTEFLEARIAVERTVNWARRSLQAKKKYPFSA